VSFVNYIFNFLRFNKRNWKAVVLCLFAATIFWFFNALNKNHSANISFPLAFEFNQENYIPVKALPGHVRMNVSGIGWDLFRKSSGLKVPPLIVPLERPSDVKKIVGSTLPALFSSQLTGLQINFVITDTLLIDIDERVRRKVNIRVDSLDKYIHPDYGVVSDVSVKPDTVWLDGPRKVVNALENVIILELPKKNIDKDFNEEVEIIFKKNELVKRQPPLIEVSFKIEKLMEVSDRIKLKVINTPGRLKSTAANVTEINCTYRLPVSLANTLSGDSVRAIIDLSNYTRGKHTIAPSVVGLPKFAHLIKVDSVRINY